MCGSDLESGNDGYGNYNTSQAGLATEDLREILSVTNQPDDVNIIVETGGAGKWSTKYGISNTKLGRYHVANQKLVKDTELTYASMGLQSTFESFLKWGFTSYPAEKTGVILWNHGGAMRGVCYDEKKDDDCLLNSEVSAALKNAFKSSSISSKLEFIGYDACLMQVQDIAEANSEYFNYMIAAEESEAGEGWEYSSWVDDLYAKKDTQVILKEICDSFVNSYTKTYGSSTNDQTLSYLDLSKMAAYKTAFESLAVQVKSKGSKSAFQTLAKTVKEYGTAVYTKQELQEAGYSTSSSSQYYYGNYGIELINGYYYDWGYNYFGTLDAKDFLNKLAANSTYSSLKTQYIDPALSALGELVVYSKKGSQAGNSNGLALYFPLHSLCEKSKYYSTSETTFTNWRSVVNTFGA